MKKKYVLKKEVKEFIQDEIISLFGLLAILAIVFMLMIIGG